MPAVVRRSLTAMACRFEAILAGDDPEHLGAVAAAALGEVARLESILSRHDPAAELARVNREATARAVTLSVPLFEAIEDCLRWHHLTSGSFDVGLPDSGGVAAPLPDRLALDPGRRAVRFLDDRLAIDLGGYGKGLAIDRAGALVRSFGVASALLHGGTSSVLAIGRDPAGRPWPIDLRDPFDAGAPPVDRVGLADRGLSSSAAFAAGGGRSDLIDPATGRPLDEEIAVAVEAPTATAAEVLSTALLAMGRARAERLVRGGSGLPRPLRVAWMDREGGATRVDRWEAPTGDAS